MTFFLREAAAFLSISAFLVTFSTVVLSL